MPEMASHDSKRQRLENMPPSQTAVSTIETFDWKAAATESPKTIGPAFVVYDEAFRIVLGNIPLLTLVETRADKFAHEAGVYLQSTDRSYFTANYQSGKSVEIYSVGTKDLDIKQHAVPGVVNGNGGCWYRDRVLFCSQGGPDNSREPSALVLADPETSTSEVLLNNFHGRPFNSLNDVVVHHANDDLWFTDPTYGYEQAFRPSPQLPSQVYRFKPSTGQIWCVADGFVQCNGLCFSPDYKKMYVTDTGAAQAHGGPGDGHQFSLNPRLPSSIYEYDVTHGGTRLSGRRMFAYCTSGVPDGIKCDQAGNVYSGCGDGVHVWDAEGTLIGKIHVGSVVANFNFARDGLWIMAEENLFFAEIKARGALADIEGH